MKSGIINVYKEAGFTSFDVVAKMRGILHIKKIGHTGTLDPDATGVLPICIGRATKVCDFLTDRDKTYRAVMRLGITTDTLDLSGATLSTQEVHVTEDEIRSVIASFVGEINQVPPMYSALKVNGQKLCDLARKGQMIERKPRPVTIYSIQVTDISLPDVTMEVHCSKGTYIRTLCDDIGRELACGAALASLERTQAAGFYIEDTHTLCEIEKLVRDGSLDSILYPLDSIFSEYPKVIAKESQSKVLRNGGRARARETSAAGLSMAEGMRVRLYLADDTFVGIYEKKQEEFVLIKMFLENE